MPTDPAVPPERKPLAILCILAVLALLWATLWPLNPHPHNNVTWLSGSSGIRFGRRAIVFSDGPLRQLGPDSADACAIELYLRSTTRDDSGNLLTFSSDKNPEALYLRQAGQTLLIDRAVPSRAFGHKHTEMGIDDALPFQTLVLLTISSGEHGTSLYKNGKVVTRNTHFRIHVDYLYRQIVIGNWPTNA